MEATNIKTSLRTKLSLSTAFVALITVVLISFSSNYFINTQFKKYKINQQNNSISQIAKSINSQYDATSKSWNVDFLHALGMVSLNNGYIIKVFDKSGNTVWDAESCDMISCHQVMAEMVDIMKKHNPTFKGGFTTKTISLTNNSDTIGSMEIQYYGPYFYSHNDFNFLSILNTILVAIGILSLLFSILVGFLLSQHLSRPILKIADVANLISKGDYKARINEKTGTKEVDTLKGSINDLASSLEGQEDLRKQLTADVAHELRTPLTTLQTHMEAMVEGVWSPTTERLQSCHEEIVRITKMVSDLEKLAKIDNDILNLDKKNFNLTSLFNGVISGFETDIANKNLNISVEGDEGIVFADRDRINQVAINLLSNAIKYTQYGGKISILISEDKNMTMFVVKDTGIGISEHELAYIFERFYRADKSRNRTTGGTGIGLAIVKAIVEAHGGNISVSSELNVGTAFFVKLPTLRIAEFISIGLQNK